MRSIALALLALSSTTFAASYDYQFLAQRRASLAIPEYTPVQKRLVLKQARAVLEELFVHDELKVKNFGEGVNPTPGLDLLESEIDTVSSSEMHARLRDLTNRLQDRHTTYRFPLPYGCHFNFLPVDFKEVATAEGAKIAVSSVSSKPEVIDLIQRSGMPIDITQGDILVSYKGLDPFIAARELALPARGANPAAQRRQEINLLTKRAQSRDFAPESNDVEVTVKSVDGTLKTMKLPWISELDLDCAGSAPKAFSKPKRAPQYDLGMDEELIAARRVMGDMNNKSDDGYVDTIDPILKYRLLTNAHGTFAILKLTSFVPEKVSPEALVRELRRLMRSELANTDGMIIDVRDNGGGYIILAEMLAQLFGPNDVNPLAFRLKNSPANQLYWSNSPQSAFARALRKAEEDDVAYSAPVRLNNKSAINNLGQHYFRPTAVLMNSNCYSSCDMLSALLQDHAHAVIYGEDANTGAGGANNIDTTWIRNQMPVSNRGAFVEELPAGQKVGFSWRQTVRQAGAMDGELIEDAGIKADRLAPTQVEDLLTDSEAQFEQITRELKAYTPPLSNVTVANANLDLIQGETPEINLKWQGTDEIIFLENDVEISRQHVDLDSDFRSLEITGIDSSVLRKNELVLVGMLQGERVWKAVTSFRTTPRSLILQDGERLFTDFSEAAPQPFAIYSNLKANDGWMKRDAKLQVGTGPQYTANLATEAALFVTLPQQPMTLTVHLAGTTEDKFDWLKTVVVVDGVEKEVLEPLSGNISAMPYTIDLAAYAGKSVEISFQFTSDAMVEAAGPRIEQVMLW
jgi:hypothetical protein